MENAIGLVLWDAFPVTEGHTLVVPRKHVASIYELSPDEQAALWALVAEARQQLQDQLHPDGFNIGVNDGASGGPDGAARPHPRHPPTHGRRGRSPWRHPVGDPGQGPVLVREQP